MPEPGGQEVSESHTLSINVSERLDKLVDLDQAPRRLGQPLNPDVDKNNREEVQKMIGKGELQSAEDFKKASLIFQHGEILDDIKNAFELSAKAVEQEMLPVSTILVQAFDRYMVMKQIIAGVSKPEAKQRYGTQLYEENGHWVRYKIDGLASEDEKKMFEPLLEGYSDKSLEEQDAIYQRINTEWQSLTEEDRQKFLTKIKEDFSKLSR